MKENNTFIWNELITPNQDGKVCLLADPTGALIRIMQPAKEPE